MADTARPGDEGLVRSIGVRGLTAGIINVTIGGGIFVLPAIVGADLGRGAPYAYVACAVLMALVATCIASAGSRVSRTGGLYTYTEVAFGPLAGWWSGLFYLLAAVFAGASILTALAQALSQLAPMLAGPIARAGVILAIVAVLATLNVRGVKAAMGLVEAITLAKLLPIALLIVGGVWFVRADYLGWPVFPGGAALGRSAVVLVFAFVGMEVALVPSGEVESPSRTVPMAVMFGLGTATLIYLAVQAVTQGLLGPALAASKASPLADAAGRALGPIAQVIVAGGASVSMFGYASGDMLGSPRSLFAFARDGQLPRVLARVHPRFRTPYVAIWVYAAVVATLAITSSFEKLALVANVASMSQYLLCVAAAWELQRRNVVGDGAPLRLPGGPLIPALAACAIVWLLSHATWQEFTVEAVVIAAGTTAFLVRRALR